MSSNSEQRSSCMDTTTQPTMILGGLHKTSGPNLAQKSTESVRVTIDPTALQDRAGAWDQVFVDGSQDAYSRFMFDKDGVSE